MNLWFQPYPIESCITLGDTESTIQLLSNFTFSSQNLLNILLILLASIRHWFWRWKPSIEWGPQGPIRWHILPDNLRIVTFFFNCVTTIIYNSNQVQPVLDRFPIAWNDCSNQRTVFVLLKKCWDNNIAFSTFNRTHKSSLPDFVATEICNSNITITIPTQTKHMFISHF